ncbi:MAG: winged helix-turn-helix domain-containing protein [Lewinella sp.]|nr:winged helix-turn-helix domain-containing protein [Lewinella sp.]
MKSSPTAISEPFLLDQRFYINPGANEIGFYNGHMLDPVLKVEPRLMEVLVCLARARGKVVRKEQLIQEIWDNYGGGEEALLQSVSRLRKVLQDDARNPSVIETIPKKGYRLLSRVSLADRFQASGNSTETVYTAPVIIQQVGLFTGFLERLTNLRFFLVFVVFSAILIAVLGLVYQIVFWWAVSS